MIGIDIINISSVEKAIKSEAFLSRVFTETERKYCDNAPIPKQSYAGIFCAKEAAVKALKCGFGEIMPSDIEVIHDDKHAPFLRFLGKAEKAFFGLTGDVSISHDGDFATAVVLLTKKDDKQ